MDPLAAHFAAMARNNAWANDRLLSAVVALGPAEFEAPRAGFFPSLRETLNHIHFVDLYYFDALTEGGRGRAVYAAPLYDDPAALKEAQAAADTRLIAFCDALAPEDPARQVLTDRGADGRIPERIGALLPHLFQHQIHHRGQAHAMLSQAGIKPPQLDEFFLDYDRHPSALAYG